MKKNVVTTLYYMGGSYGSRYICYVRSKETGVKNLKSAKHDSFAPGFMVWAAVVIMTSPS